MKFSTSVTKFLPLTLTAAFMGAVSMTTSSMLVEVPLVNRSPITIPLNMNTSFLVTEGDYPTNIVADVSSVVEPLIEEMRDGFNQLPLVRYLDNVPDESSSLSKKLMFLPYMTFFVNSFSDLNRIILPYDDNHDMDPYKMAINQHCHEDSNHMYLLWKDLDMFYDKILASHGVDSFSTSVKLLWGEAMKPTRALGYEISRIVGSTTSSTGADNKSNLISKYSMIRVMEEVGNVFFEIAAGYEMTNDESGEVMSSSYLSHDHLELENGHLQHHDQGVDHEGHHHDEDEDDEDVLTGLFGQLQLHSEEEKEQVEFVMKQTYELFVNMLNSVYENMISQTAENCNFEEDEEGCN